MRFLSAAYSSTARAILMPSKVEVPLPISSKIIRLLEVALLSIDATSLISTINVDCPAERSSDAPIRVNTLSTIPSSALAAGTKLPACAHDADECDLTHICGLTCHVGTGYYRTAVVGTVENSVIRNERFAVEHFFNNGMASFVYLYNPALRTSEGRHSYFRAQPEQMNRGHRAVPLPQRYAELWQALRRCVF